jgi:hypothetical protein
MVAQTCSVLLHSSLGGLYKSIAPLTILDSSVQPHFIHHSLIVRLETPLFFPHGELSIAIFIFGLWKKRYSLCMISTKKEANIEWSI